MPPASYPPSCLPAVAATAAAAAALQRAAAAVAVATIVAGTAAAAAVTAAAAPARAALAPQLKVLTVLPAERSKEKETHLEHVHHSHEFVMQAERLAAAPSRQTSWEQQQPCAAAAARTGVTN